MQQDRREEKLCAQHGCVDCRRVVNSNTELSTHRDMKLQSHTTIESDDKTSYLFHRQHRTKD